jgi:hypothetical protein
VVATLLALVPWVGLLLDVLTGPDNPPGPPTNATCDTAWCFPSLDHVVLDSTILPAAICAAAAAAVAVVVLANRRAFRWPLAVIALAAVAMILYGVFV